MALATGLLLLADGRSPTGGVSHSSGVEEAVRAGVVVDEQTLAALLAVRLHATGMVNAGIAAAACRRAAEPAELVLLDLEADARTPSAAARDASRAQGRGLLRLARASWPHPAYAKGGVLGDRPHHAVVLGVAVAAADGEPSDAASIAVLASITGPASAAVRLLGLDPLAVTAILARMSSAVDAVALEALVALEAYELPAASHPLLEIFAEQHAARDATLFAS
jgi:urease accessory protein